MRTGEHGPSVVMVRTPEAMGLCRTTPANSSPPCSFPSVSSSGVGFPDCFSVGKERAVFVGKDRGGKAGDGVGAGRHLSKGLHHWSDNSTLLLAEFYLERACVTQCRADVLKWTKHSQEQSGLPFAGHVKAGGMGREKPGSLMCQSDLRLTISVSIF